MTTKIKLSAMIVLSLMSGAAFAHEVNSQFKIGFMGYCKSLEERGMEMTAEMTQMYHELEEGKTEFSDEFYEKVVKETVDIAMADDGSVAKRRGK